MAVIKREQSGAVAGSPAELGLKRLQTGRRASASDGAGSSVEAAIARARQEGLRLGREEVHEEAFASHRDALAGLETAWLAALRDLERARQELLDGAAADALEFAMELARRIIHRSIECDPSLVTLQVAEALKLVTKPGRISIAMHPLDRPLIEQAMPDLASSMSHASQAALVTRDDIERGGCIVTADGGVIDARIGVQMERIVEALIPYDQTSKHVTLGTAGARP